MPDYCYRRNLPHWREDDVVYFVTWRLARAQAELAPDERELVASGVLTLVPPGPNLVDELGELIGDRPVYIHLDCDVLDPGIVPTEYRVPGGLSLIDLERAAARLARNPLVGLEIAEFESEWVENGRPGEPDRIVNALWPLLGPLQAS